VIQSDPSLRDVLVLLDRLHRPKDRAYGDAWRRRGEVLGIFANIARKFDRLAIALVEDARPGTESLLDTVADLCVYAGKYATWLAESVPDVFEQRSGGVSASKCDARIGPDALTGVFDAILRDDRRARPPADFGSAVGAVREAFGELETGLVAQSEGRAVLTAHRKVEIAFDLTAASAWLLVALSREDESVLAGLTAEVERMEAAGT
jgi:hypothetical protein